jgi:hypothetical protein
MAAPVDFIRFTAVGIPSIGSPASEIYLSEMGLKKIESAWYYLQDFRPGVCL